MRAWPVDLALLATGHWPTSPQRLGWGTAPVQPGSVWIHAASLGEARVGRRIADALSRPTLLTTDTAAGLSIADSLRPVDHPWTLAPLWAEARPTMLLFIESSWYPALARLARYNAVPILSIATRPGRFASLRNALLGGPDAVFLRSAEDRAWFESRSIPVLGLSGTLKGGPPGPNPLRWSTPFIAGISTRPGDDAALIAARDQVFPELPLLLAPRHSERVPQVQALTGAALRSSLTEVPPHTDVVVDTQGELDSLIRGASVALIGGSFDPQIGGHSPAEARWAGVPFVHGPHIHSNRADFHGGHLAPRPADLAGALRSAWGRPAPPIKDALPEVIAQIEAHCAAPAPESSPRPWARPFTPLQRLGMRVRRIRSGYRAAVPVLAIGSANARGSGKTSTALWIAAQLGARGHRVGVATRGYGRLHRALGDSRFHGADPRWLGDEGALFALRGLHTTAHPDRARAVRALSECSVILLEDGLQTTSVRADLRIETLDARFPTARGLIPAGEGRGLHQPSDLRIAHHTRAEFRVDTLLRAHRRPSPWSPSPPQRPLAAFAGIGRSADFFANLQSGRVCSFPDHHTYGLSELEELSRWSQDRDLVTTDRDAVRIPAPWRARIDLRWRGVELEIPDFPLDLLP